MTKVRQLVALAHAGIAAHLTTALDVVLTLGILQIAVEEQIELLRFIRRGIGPEEFATRGLEAQLTALHRERQLLRVARARI